LNNSNGSNTNVIKAEESLTQNESTIEDENDNEFNLTCYRVKKAKTKVWMKFVEIQLQAWNILLNDCESVGLVYLCLVIFAELVYKYIDRKANEM
jgi:hypothetical protein